MPIKRIITLNLEGMNVMIKDFTPEQLSSFQAYTRLTVVAHVKGQKEHNTAYKNNEVSFKDFQDILEEKKMVNESLSRDVDEWVNEHSKAQIRAHNNPEMESRTMNYVEQAFRLGFVDAHGLLIQPNTRK